MVKITEEVKDLIEKNAVALASTMPNFTPNVIGVTFIKVINENRLLITDNYMNQTIEDIQKNKNVCLLSWDKDMKGYKLIGQAEYLSSGKWLDFVKNMPENAGLSAKGAILVKVVNIIPSA